MSWEAVQAAHDPRIMDGTARTTADWLEMHLDLGKVINQPEAFTHLWFTAMDPTEVPRWWLASEVQQYQQDSKVTPSSPYDAQHASYLLDCDLFITADKSLARTLALVARDAPFLLPPVCTIPGDDQAAALSVHRVLVEVRMRQHEDGPGPELG